MNDSQTERLIAAFEKIATALSGAKVAAEAVAETPPAKATKPAAQAKAPVTKAVEAEKPTPVAEPEVEFDYEVLKANTVALAASGAAGRQAVGNVLKKLGADSMKTLPAARWEEANGLILAAKAEIDEADVA